MLTCTGAPPPPLLSKGLVISHPSIHLLRCVFLWRRPVDECLLALLSGPHAEAALAFLHSPPSDWQPAGAARLLRACLERPTPTRAQVALALVRHSEAARLELASSLPGLLAQAQTGPSKRQRAKEAAGEGGGGQLLLACALPAAVALLERHSQGAAAAGTAGAAGAAAAGGPVDEPRQQSAAALVASLRDPLLSYFTSKRAAEAGDGSSASASSAPPDAEAAAAALLRAHALPCLRLCLALHPPGREEREVLLGKLLHPQGFSFKAVAGVVGDGAAADPATSQAQRSAERAAAAVVLLLARGGGGAARRPGAAELLRYLQAHAATLATLFK